MSTAEMRKTLLSWLESEKDESRILHLFNEMKSIRSEERATIEEYNADLENTMEEYRSGKFISHEDMKKEIASW